jgi:hypothetical protein
MLASKILTRPGASSETLKRRSNMTKCVAMEPEARAVPSSKVPEAHTTKTFLKTQGAPTVMAHLQDVATPRIKVTNKATRKPPTGTTTAMSTPSTPASTPTTTPRSRPTNKTLIKNTKKLRPNTSNTFRESVNEEPNVVRLSPSVIRGSNSKNSCVENNRNRKTTLTR